MPFEDLVLLSPEDLSVVLRACEPAVILLALSGASESFYKRFKSMLHPRDARRLDARLANQGPMQMRDIDRAQLQMSQAAGQLLASGRIGSLMNMTFTAAA
jgi:flagellar motor switch protein FliG